MSSHPKVGVLIFATEKYSGYASDLSDSLLFEAIGLRRDDPVDSEYVRKMNQRVNWYIGPVSTPFPLPWPLGTLLRPFWYRRALLETSWLGEPPPDYIFAMDADLRVVAPLDWSEMVGERVGTLHPGFTGPHEKPGSFERDGTSAACIPLGHNSPYFAGGFWGGSRGEFANVCGRMCEIIEKDLKNKNGRRIAEWEDESVLNRVFYDTPPTKILGPEYLTPDEEAGWYLGDRSKARILALSKDHAAMRAV